MKAKKILSIITAAAIAVSNVYMPVYAEETETAAVEWTASGTGSGITLGSEETIHREESAETDENDRTGNKETETQSEKNSESEEGSEIKSDLQESVAENGNETGEKETVIPSGSTSPEETGITEESIIQEKETVTAIECTGEEEFTENAEENGCVQNEEGVQTESDYQYRVESNGEITITWYTGSDSDIFIPAEIDGRKVTSIGDEAFYSENYENELYFLRSVTLPEGIKSIGEYAFYGCPFLRSVILSEGVESIGECAFSECQRLTDIILPDSITSIGEYAFSDCIRLQGITIPRGVTRLEDGILSGCYSLRSIIIPKSVKEIGEYVIDLGEEIDSFITFDIFYEGTKEEWIQVVKAEDWFCMDYYMDDGYQVDINYHYNYSYSDNTLLDSSITIASDKQSYTKTYGDAAFQLEGISKTGDGTLVYTVTSGNDVVEVSSSGMVTIKNAGTAVITVSMAATDTYKKAESKTISITVNPNLVQTEGDYLYKVEDNGEITITGYTGSDADILIPSEIDGKKVTSIGDEAFYSENYENELYFLRSVTLPEGIKSIGKYAFYGCPFLRSVILSEGVESIGECAFSECQRLTDIILPDSITNIGEYAFSDCIRLQSITIPRGVTRLEDGILSGCYSLRSIIIPKSVKEIGEYVIDLGEEIDSFVTFDIFYEGTKEEWIQVVKAEDWFCMDYYMDDGYQIDINYHYNYSYSDNTLLDSSITIAGDKQSYTKTYGDAAFQLEGISKTGDGTLVYTVTSGNDVVEVSSSGMVTIKNAGTAVVTVSMAATDTYKEAESKTISITVNKKVHINVAPQTFSYNYKSGSSGETSIDFSKLIAEDTGNTTYALGTETDSNDILTASIDQDTGILTYIVQDGSIGTTASIEVTVTMQNYMDCIILLQVNLEEKEEEPGTEESSGSEESSGTEESSGSEESSSTEESSGNEESSSTEESSGNEESSGSEEKDDAFSVSTITSQAYTGNAIKPDVIVTHNGRRLVPGQDYTLTYKNNTKVGTATVTVRGRGNYSETQSVPFNIERKDLNSSGVIIDDLALPYNAKGKIPKKAPVVTYNGKQLKEGTDYTVSYGDGNFKDAGTYTVTITGKGNFKGEASGKVVILDKSMIINNAKVVLSQKKCDYTGSEVRPSVAVMLKGTLVENKDYTVSYADNIMPGKATVIIRGKGDYAGTKRVNFTINKQVVNLTDSMVSVPTSVVYEKGGCTPEPTVIANGVMLTKGSDYTVSYKNNKKTGTAALVIKGKGIYKGTVSRNFMIAPKDISKTFMRAPDVVYTVKSSRKAGKYISRPVLTDTNGNVLGTSDYMNVVYECGSETLNKKSIPAVGSVIKVTVTGKGNYTGTASTEYVLKDALSFIKTKVSISDKTYTGGKVTLKSDDIKVTMKGSTLKYGKDYEIIASSYRNNNKKGTAQVTIRGKGDYAGEKTVKFKITTRKINVK